MTPDEERVLNDPTSTKQEKRVVSARRAFRGASAARLLRGVDADGAEAGAFIHACYEWCMTLPVAP